MVIVNQDNCDAIESMNKLMILFCSNLVEVDMVIQ